MAQWLIATAIGAVLGALLAQKLPAQWLNQMLPVVVFACAVYLLFGRTPKVHEDNNPIIKTKRQWPQGLSLGFYDGVAGLVRVLFGRSAPCCFTLWTYCAPAV